MGSYECIGEFCRCEVADFLDLCLFIQLGPEKGVMHLAVAAIVNALWDLWAKLEGKPLWKLLTDLEPEVSRDNSDIKM